MCLVEIYSRGVGLLSRVQKGLEMRARLSVSEAFRRIDRLNGTINAVVRTVDPPSACASHANGAGTARLLEGEPILVKVSEEHSIKGPCDHARASIDYVCVSRDRVRVFCRRTC